MESTTPAPESKPVFKSILPTSIPELIKAWEDGEVITSIKFPTHTPSHEQSAQIAFFHCVKDNHSVPCEPFQWDDLCNLTIGKLGTSILPLEKPTLDAIKWLAYEVCKSQSPKEAYEKVFEHNPKLQLQAVTRRFPFVLNIPKQVN